MSVLISDIRYYGSADMPEADSATIGGAIDFTKRVEFADIATNGLFDAVSSSASDTATKITYMGRDSSGVTQTETLTLTGQSKVAGTKTLQRLLAAVTTGGAIAGLTNPGGSAAVGDVALISHTLTVSGHTMQAGSANATTANPAIAVLQSGDGSTVLVGQILHTTANTGLNQIRRILAINPNGLGADTVAIDRNWTTLPDNTTTYEVGFGFHFELTGSNGGVAITGTSTQVLAITRMFATLTAQAFGGSTVTAYEKIFANNNNQTTALTTTTIEILSETGSLPGSALLDLALCTGFNDTNTYANRQTTPVTGVGSFVTQPSPIAVPSTGNLAASAGAGSATNAMGMIPRLTLPAGTAAYEGYATIRAAGSTT